MDIRRLRTDDDHREALKEIERLWGAEPGTADGDKFDVLATLVEAYESKRWFAEPVTPLEILRSAISDDGRTQAELAESARSVFRPHARSARPGKSRSNCS